MGKKWKPISIYPQKKERKEVEIKIPKVYRVNGDIIVGEYIAMYCKEIGMKVEEM